MKSFADQKAMYLKVVDLQDEIKNNLQTYIEKENIGVSNFKEKLFQRLNEVAAYIFDELNEQSVSMKYLTDNMENLEGDAQIISAFIRAYITDQIIIETVSFEELENV